jgi:hypothetical protein
MIDACKPWLCAGPHATILLRPDKEESEAMYRNVLEVRERTLGPQHANTLRAKANLAETVAEMVGLSSILSFGVVSLVCQFAAFGILCSFHIIS